MKMRCFKNIKIAFAVVMGFSLLSACVNKDEFFELPDRNGLDQAIWSTEGAIQFHLNKAYDVIIPEFGYAALGTTQMHGRSGIHYASDESFLPFEDDYALAALGLGGEPLSNNSVFYTGNKYTSNKGDNKYNDISRCNDAIKNIPLGALSRDVQKIYLGQYYALRAMVYFGMVKVYGGVPLVLEPQSPENITASGRASAKECFESIVKDLDSAIVMLDGVAWSDGTARGKLTKAAASALKGKALLYWASPQFNPNNDPSRWTDALEANRQAYLDCLAAGHELSGPGTYGSIFRTEPNKEAIIVRTYSSTLPKRGHNIEQESRPSNEGGDAKKRYIASTRLIDAYPMKDGNKVGSSSSTYTYNDITFYANRDPRFNATLAYNGASWPLSAKGESRKQWVYKDAVGGTASGIGVYCKRFTSPDLSTGSVRYNSDIGGGSGMDWIELRFAEVILNYAECANETGDIATAKNMVEKIRIRAGIEKGTGTNNYGLGDVTGVVEMRELIFNERFIEFAFENKRNSDLRRMRKMHLLQGDLSTIYIEPKDSNAKKALESVVDVATGKTLRETLDLNNVNTYLQYFAEPARATEVNRTFNIPEYHIFYTFHNDFVYTGSNIQPTIGWAGGTFNPLD